jgi:hypothetical protein
MSLPPELREEIYYHAIKDFQFPEIDTAAIPGTPDRIIIPAIAQASRQVRSEALGVFFRNRPVVISLYCRENTQRAKLWAESWVSHAREFSIIIFKGNPSRRARKLLPHHCAQLEVEPALCSPKDAGHPPRRWTASG